MPELIRGAKVAMGGQDWTIPPLNFKAIRALQESGDLERLDQGMKLGAGIKPEDLDALLRIVQAAMKRNYPDITTADLEDMLDLGNAFDVVRAILSISGIKPPGGDAPPGEAPAAAETPAAS